MKAACRIVPTGGRGSDAVSATFSRTIRSLRTGGKLESSGFILGALAVALVWALWFGLSRVAVYETSDAARLEVADAVVPVYADAAGLVVSSHIAVGEDIAAGDLLVELDAEADRRQLAEEVARSAGLVEQLAALERQLAVEEQNLETIEAAAEATISEAREQHALAGVTASFAREEAERLAELRKIGSASELELLRARASAETARKSEEVAAVAIGRVQRDQQARVAAQRAACESLRKERTRLSADQQETQARIERLEHAVARRVIRAPIAGRVAETAALRPGTYVQPGERVATIIPPGSLRVVANFSPASALGRIRPGQPARVRLHGFPWGQYGSLAATVTQVAEEPREGQVRVECRLDAASASAVPLSHGLPGSLEVQVERTSPAALVMRIAGRAVARAASPDPGNG